MFKKFSNSGKIRMASDILCRNKGQEGPDKSLKAQRERHICCIYH